MLSLVEEMDEILNHGVEEFSDNLRTNSDTKTAFRAMTGVIVEISEYVQKKSKGMVFTLLRKSKYWCLCSYLVA